MFKKPVVLKAYTHKADVYDKAKILKGSSLKPDWWKSLPVQDYLNLDPDTAKNMRLCSGFNDLFAKSFILPLWSDLQLSFGPVGDTWWSYRYADEQSSARSHPDYQRNKWLNEENFQHFQLVNPWIITCDENVDFLFTNADWYSDDVFRAMVPNGVLNFKRQHEVNINMLFKRDEQNPTTVVLKHSEPLGMLVPMTERKVVIEHHLVSTEEYAHIRDKSCPRGWFMGGYYKAPKCPFSGK